ncbi:hypothetical protein NN561_019940 [Cricetulus griseus]
MTAEARARHFRSLRTTPLPLGEKITRTVRQERRRDAERRNFLSFTGNRVSIWAKINAQSYLKMATGGDGGDFDLADALDEPEPEAGGSPQGLVPGIVGAVVAALAGAVSSFVAYQKRRLCFRESGPAPV